MIEGYGFVTEKEGKKYYRSLTNPKDEIVIDGKKKSKLKTKIRSIIKDKRGRQWQ